MFPGSPAPLRPSCRLHRIAALAQPGEVLGVWVTGRRPGLAPLRIRCRPGVLLAAGDLGALLRRCRRVAVADGPAVRAIPAERLIGWRVLEIVLGAPYLPPPEQLRALFPALRVDRNTVALPLGLGSAEEALGLCAAARVPVVASRIRYAAVER